MIAEDDSDVDVIFEVLSKLTSRPFAIRSFVGRGCGKIVNKFAAWARDLRARGCTRLIVVHDLDDRRLQTFRPELIAELGASPIGVHVIVIPVREIEAWLLADHAAIGRTAKSQRPLKQIPNPEALHHPKEFLRDVLYRVSDKKITYVNTVHNKTIAKYASLKSLRRCTSFQRLEAFAVGHLR